MHVNRCNTDWLTFMTVPSAMRRVTGRNATCNWQECAALLFAPSLAPSPPCPIFPDSWRCRSVSLPSWISPRPGEQPDWPTLVQTHQVQWDTEPYKPKHCYPPPSQSMLTYWLVVRRCLGIAHRLKHIYRHAVLFDWLCIQKLSAETVTDKCVHCYPLPTLVFCCLDPALKHTYPGQLHERGVFHTGRRWKAACQ